ncbi:MAG: YceD family protein, partial [Anaerolineales bacterium]
GILDLTPLVRELALVAMPIRPLCREDCKGLCPECGADRNTVSCGHRQDEPDRRLAALEGLRDSL